MASYQDYSKMLQDYFASQGPGPDAPYFDPQAEVSGYSQAPGYDEALKTYQDYNTNTGQNWLDSLTSQQRQEYNTYHQQAVDANKKKARNGALIALGAPLAAAGAGALGAFGGLGEAGGALSGATSFPVYSPALPILTDIPGALTAGLGAAAGAGTGGAGAGTTGGIGDIGGTIGGVTDTIGKTFGGKNGLGNLLGGIGLGAGGLAAIQAFRNRNDMPQLPDFTKLAEQTAASQNAATDHQTLMNRPNQTNAQGDTSTWAIGPDGRPIQKTQYGAANQQAFNQNNATLAALRNQMTAQAGRPLNAPVMGNAMANALRTTRVL